MFGLFSKREQVTRALVVDIGSASVGVGVAELHDDGKPIMCATARANMRLREEIKFKDFYLAMLDALSEALEQLKKMEGASVGSVKQVHLTFASPWYNAEARTIQYTKETPFRFNRKLLNSLLEKDLKIFQKEFDAKKQVEEGDKLLMLDRSIIDLRLNGYPTKHEEADSVHEVEATVFISLMSKRVRDAVVKRIKDVCGTSRYTLQSFPMVLYASIRDMMAVGDDFVLADVGGEVTDVVFVHDTVPERTYSLPLGHNTLVRHLASRLGTSLEHAQSSLTMFADKKIDPSEEENIKGAIQDVLNKFRESLAEIVAEQAQDFMLPPLVFATIDEGPMKWLKAGMGVSTIESLTIDAYTVTPIVLSGAILDNYIKYNRGVRRDTFLALESYFLEKIIYLDDFMERE